MGVSRRQAIFPRGGVGPELGAGKDVNVQKSFHVLTLEILALIFHSEC